LSKKKVPTKWAVERCSLVAFYKTHVEIMEATQISLPLPVLPAGWSADHDFKSLNGISGAIQRNIEPVGPHFLAYARRKR